jgi:diadenosine tetraphosphate (Ap4A) HIT family hydrolase
LQLPEKKECVLCAKQNYPTIWADGFCRVILINDQNYPGYCRVDLISHKKEMSDLFDEEKLKLMRVVFKLESLINIFLKPDKINLASLGNIIPHVHWHVIPRFKEDRHFPKSIWSESQRMSKFEDFEILREKEFIKYLSVGLN